MVLGHDILDFCAVILQKAKVAVCQDSDQLPFLTNRHTGNFILCHNLIRVIDKMLRGQIKRIRNYAVFRALYGIHFVRLRGNAHIFMNDANAAFSRNGNCHFGCGNRIHCRGQKRRIQTNSLYKICGNIDVGWYDFRFCGNQKHVVEGKTLFRKLLRCISVQHTSSILSSMCLLSSIYFYYHITILGLLQ